MSWRLPACQRSVNSTRAVLKQPAFVATDGDFSVYTRWIEEEFSPSVDVRTLADGNRVAGRSARTGGKLGRGRWQTRAIGPARFARLPSPRWARAGRISWSRRNGGLCSSSDSGESVIQAPLNAYQKSVPAGSDTQTAATSDIASTQDTLSNRPSPASVVRWLADDGAHVEETSRSSYSRR